MRVLIPSALQSYTRLEWVEASGATVAELMADLECRYPGIRFRMIDEQQRIRRHIRFFYQREMVFDLSTPLEPDKEFLIVQALSGG